MKLSTLAAIIGAELIGNDAEISGINSLNNATATEVSILLDNLYLHDAHQSLAKAIVTNHRMLLSKQTILFHPNPRSIMATLLSMFALPKKTNIGISKLSSVGENVVIGHNVWIDDFVKIGSGTQLGEGVQIYSNVTIGNNVCVGAGTIIFPHVTVFDGISIGCRVILETGCKIGTEGFGFVLDSSQAYTKIPQLGSVIIHDDVEIGANTCIDRGTLGNTIIKKGTKIDNLVHIAHNVCIGENCALTGLIALAGSTVIGDRVQFGGQSGTAGHLRIGDDTVVMARTGVTKDIPAKSIVSGFPAQNHHDEMTLQAKIRHFFSKKGVVNEL